MKRGIALLALLSAFSTGIYAADFNGYIIDEACSSKPAMKGNEACARKCIKGGSAAVLLTPEAKVYKLDDQAKVSEHAGHKVVVTGALNGDTIKVESIKIDSGCVPGPTGCQ
jgi:Protein of unknown function (DUF5818)